MITKSSGFSLVELLVVVAIVGILSSISVVAYNGYVSGTKKSSAKNMMQQISLGQSDYLSSYGEYYFTNVGGSSCEPDQAGGQGASSTAINTNLFSGGQIITAETSWDMCIEEGAGGFVIKATNGTDQLTLDQNGTWGESYWIIVWYSCSMKKVLLILFLLPLLSNCTQYTAMVGPSLTMVESGNILKASSSLSSSFVMKNMKQNLVSELKSEKICPTVHSSELNQIFFETIEHTDCFYDPMSIYR